MVRSYRGRFIDNTDEADLQFLKDIRNGNEKLRGQQTPHIESVKLQGGVGSNYYRNICDQCGEEYAYKGFSLRGELICPDCAELYDLPYKGRRS